MDEQRPGKEGERAEPWVIWGRESGVGLQQCLYSHQPLNFICIRTNILHLKATLLFLFSFSLLLSRFLSYILTGFLRTCPQPQTSKWSYYLGKISGPRKCHLCGRNRSQIRNSATISKSYNFRKIDWISVSKLNDPVNKAFKYSTVAIENTFDFTVGRKYLQELEN